MQALTEDLVDALERMCETEFPAGMREALIAEFGPGTDWALLDEGVDMRLCPNAGRDDPHVGCGDCGVEHCYPMMPVLLVMVTARIACMLGGAFDHDVHDVLGWHRDDDPEVDF